MEKKVYIVPQIDEYSIRTGEYCQVPTIGGSADNTDALGKDSDWDDEDWED